MVYNVLINNIIDSAKYKIYDDYLTSKFYNDYFIKVLIINFMRMARATDENDPFEHKILLLLLIFYVQKLIMLIVYMIKNSYEYL